MKNSSKSWNASINGKCPWRDSNAQPTAPQAVALSIKLQGLMLRDGIILSLIRCLVKQNEANKASLIQRL